MVPTESTPRRGRTIAIGAAVVLAAALVGW